jgi:hypothetical protein
MFRCTRYVRNSHQYVGLIEKQDNVEPQSYSMKRSNSKTASIHSNWSGSTLVSGGVSNREASRNDVGPDNAPIEKNHSKTASLRTIYSERGLNPATSLESQLSNDNCRGNTLVSGEVGQKVFPTFADFM